MRLREWATGIDWTTKLDKIKDLHSTDTIATENSGTRGRPIWVHSSQGGKADSKWVCHVVPAYPNVSPGPMNGSILLRWAYRRRIKLNPGSAAHRLLTPGLSIHPLVTLLL